MNESSRSAVSLLPIFRSQAQYRLVGELFTSPARASAVGELAERIGASHPTVSREVARLEEAGLLTTWEEGRRRLVAPVRGTPVFGPLRDLMAVVYGVPAILREEFGPLDAQVEIFGSWAARWAGEPGPTPNDVDVLVVGDVDPTNAWAAAARATRRAGIEVNVVVRTEREWAEDDSGFAREVRTGPRIPVSSPSSDGSPAPEGVA